MCKSSPSSGPSKEEERREVMRGNPFRGWDLDPRRDHRGKPHKLGVAPVLVLAALACGRGGNGRDVPPEDDDPMHHRLRRELGGKHDRERRWFSFATLPAVLVACVGGDDKEKNSGPVFRLRHFTSDAVAILTGPDQGGRFLAERDLRGWARYVFLDDSIERHPFNCRYVRVLRAVRGIGRIGGVA